MGTRAAFWVGNPMDLAKREWLGCVAWDGYPEGFDGIERIRTEQEFRDFVQVQSRRNDFANPQKGWPYPWDDNIFLTDYTYAFFDGKLWMARFRRGFVLVEHYFVEGEDVFPEDETLPENIPAPSQYNAKQPDSILIVNFK